MSSVRTETQITWSSGSASVTLTSATAVASDAMLFNAEDWDVDIQVNANNSGTPASGDIVGVYIQWTSGDILGDSGDDYDTTEYSEPLGQLDTFPTNVPGENPARRTFHINSASKGFKLVLVASQAASRNIVVRARYIAHRPQ